MTDTLGRPTLDHAWEQQSVWSQGASKMKSTIEHGRLGGLLLGIAAAALATAASQTMNWNALVGKALAAAAALTAGVIPLLIPRTGPQQLSAWTRLRAVSEAFKTEVYCYLTGVGKYCDAGTRDVVLAERLAEFRRSSADLVRYIDGLSPRHRPLPPVTDVKSYIEHRVRQQLNEYYRPRALLMRRKLKRCERSEMLLGTLSAGLAAASAATGQEQVAAWVAVVTSAVIAVGAHAVSQRYAYQELEFIRTADELQRLLEQWASSSDHGDEAAESFVASCESVISVQNEAWMIRWTIG